MDHYPQGIVNVVLKFKPKNKKRNTSCMVFKLRIHLNLHQPYWFLMPVPSYLVIFYWHMWIRYSFKSLFIDILMGDGDRFIPIIWPSLWLLFDLAGLIKSCIWTLADSLMGPFLIMTARGDFPSLSFLFAEVHPPSICFYLLSQSFSVFCILVLGKSPTVVKLIIMM